MSHGSEHSVVPSRQLQVRCMGLMMGCCQYHWLDADHLWQPAHRRCCDLCSDDVLCCFTNIYDKLYCWLL